MYSILAYHTRSPYMPIDGIPAHSSRMESLHTTWFLLTVAQDICTIMTIFPMTAVHTTNVQYLQIRGQRPARHRIMSTWQSAPEVWRQDIKFQFNSRKTTNEVICMTDSGGRVSACKERNVAFQIHPSTVATASERGCYRSTAAVLNNHKD